MTKDLSRAPRRGALQLDRAATEPVVQQAEEMAGLLDAAAPAPHGRAKPANASDRPSTRAGLDRSILNYAILNGASNCCPSPGPRWPSSRCR